MINISHDATMPSFEQLEIWFIYILSHTCRAVVFCQAPQFTKPFLLDICGTYDVRNIRLPSDSVAIFQSGLANVIARLLSPLPVVNRR